LKVENFAVSWLNKNPIDNSDICVYVLNFHR